MLISFQTSSIWKKNYKFFTKDFEFTINHKGGKYQLQTTLYIRLVLLPSNPNLPLTFQNQTQAASLKQEAKQRPLCFSSVQEGPELSTEVYEGKW